MDPEEQAGREGRIEPTEAAGDPTASEALERTALEVGGGAAAGAVIGRILGGGARATVIGAVVGAAAGTALSLGGRWSRDRTGEPTNGRERGGGQHGRRVGEDGEAEAEPLQSWTKARLYEAARHLDIPGRSRMNKRELLGALRDHPEFEAL